MKVGWKLTCSLVFVCVGLICTPRSAFAQGYGTISGTVTDSP
jgi:hypothetical protein